MLLSTLIFFIDEIIPFSFFLLWTSFSFVFYLGLIFELDLDNPRALS
jgi:hypothetical protein